MVARANNHTGDYGVLGLQLTSKYIREAGIVDAGAGMSLAEAREAKFLETASARVALISLSSSFAGHMRAGRSRDDVPARPGLNPLRLKTTYVLPEDSYESVRGAAESLGEFTDLDKRINRRQTQGVVFGGSTALNVEEIVGEKERHRRRSIGPEFAQCRNEFDLVCVIGVPRFQFRDGRRNRCPTIGRVRLHRQAAGYRNC